MRGDCALAGAVWCAQHTQALQAPHRMNSGASIRRCARSTRSGWWSWRRAISGRPTRPSSPAASAVSVCLHPPPPIARRRTSHFLAVTGTFVRFLQSLHLSCRRAARASVRPLQVGLLSNPAADVLSHSALILCYPAAFASPVLVPCVPAADCPVRSMVPGLIVIPCRCSDPMAWRLSRRRG